jgi:hypothetical protein
MVPDDIAPLRRLLELIQVSPSRHQLGAYFPFIRAAAADASNPPCPRAQLWSMSNVAHQESVEDDVSLLMLRPVLHMGCVVKHSAAARSEQWLVVLAGRVQFFAKPFTRWQPYPRRR